MNYVIESRSLEEINKLVEKGYRIHSTIRRAQADYRISPYCEDVLYILVKYPPTTQTL